MMAARILPFLLFLLGGVISASGQTSTATVDGRVTVYDGTSEIRRAIVRDAGAIVKDLDKLVGELQKKPFPIVVELKKPNETGRSRIARNFYVSEVGGSKYRLQIDLILGKGNSFDQAELERVILEMLLMERSLRAYPADQTAARVEVRPWLTDGVAEAIRWMKGKGERRVYSFLMESGGWIEVEKLVDRETTDGMDQLSREFFRASSGALVMALLAQPQGLVSIGNFLGEVATFEGEQLTLLRTHFPQVNLGPKGLERWWMLQVAAMSEATLTERMTIPETEEALKSALKLHFKSESGKTKTESLDSWPKVSELETLEERIAAVRPASDALVYLSFRGFSTYQPVIAGYLKTLADIAGQKTDDTENALANLQSFRDAETQRYTVMIDLMDWYHISTETEYSNQFEDYLKMKKGLEGSEKLNDPFNQYLDQVQKLYSK